MKKTANNTMDAKRMNASMINQIKPRHSLKALPVIGKLKYYRHLLHTSDSVKNYLMVGLAGSNRKRGRQQTRWSN